jgi:toxin ParE1/3/4
MNRIIWTEQAADDLEAAAAFIEQHRPGSGAKLLARLMQALTALQEHPEIGRHGRIRGTRELVLSGSPYLAVYCTDSAQITLLAFLHSSRKWPERF